MLLTDPSYFIGEINIAGISKPEISDTLNHLIDKYETILLRDILGIPLYNAFMAGLAAAPPLAQRYIDLKTGKEFQVGGLTYRWRGFIEGGTDALKKKSIIANFIYYWYVRDVASFQTPVGETQAKTENSTVTSPAVKMARAWNEMVYGIRELVFFLEWNRDTYPEYYYIYPSLSYTKTINAFGI